jgi:hypothetical protein
MPMNEEERRRNMEAGARQLNEDVEGFLREYEGFPGGFSEDDLAEFVRSERVDRHAATRLILRLKDQGRVHRMAGRWHVGPLPPESQP